LLSDPQPGSTGRRASRTCAGPGALALSATALLEE